MILGKIANTPTRRPHTRKHLIKHANKRLVITYIVHVYLTIKHVLCRPSNKRRLSRLSAATGGPRPEIAPILLSHTRRMSISDVHFPHELSPVMREDLS